MLTQGLGQTELGPYHRNTVTTAVSQDLMVRELSFIGFIAENMEKILTSSFSQIIYI